MTAAAEFFASLPARLSGAGEDTDPAVIAFALDGGGGTDAAPRTRLTAAQLKAPGPALPDGEGKQAYHALGSGPGRALGRVGGPGRRDGQPAGGVDPDAPNRRRRRRSADPCVVPLCRRRHGGQRASSDQPADQQTGQQTSSTHELSPCLARQDALFALYIPPAEHAIAPAADKCGAG